jgi:hypothetical protein
VVGLGEDSLRGDSGRAGREGGCHPVIEFSGLVDVESVDVAGVDERFAGDPPRRLGGEVGEQTGTF